MTGTNTYTLNKQHPLARGLVSCWHARASAHGLRWWDVCGRNHGTLNGGAAWRGDHLLFDGVDDYVSVAAPPIGSSVTLSARVFTSDVRELNRTWTFGGGSPCFRFYSATHQEDVVIGGSFVIQNFGTYTPNEWALYSMVSTPDRFQVFKNGVLLYQDGGGYGFTFSSGSIGIGDFGEWHGGGLTDFRIWDRGLSAAEVRSLYRDPLAIFNRIRQAPAKTPAAPTGNRRRRLLIGAAG